LRDLKDVIEMEIKVREGFKIMTGHVKRFDKEDYVCKVYEIVCRKLEPLKVVGSDERRVKDVRTISNEVFDENDKLIDNPNSVD
jgi:hypothetical protein